MWFFIVIYFLVEANITKIIFNDDKDTCKQYIIWTIVNLVWMLIFWYMVNDIVRVGM